MCPYRISPLGAATAVPLNVVPDAVFSGALDPTTVIPQNVYLTNPSGTTVSSTLTLDATGTITHLTPSAPLAANSQYSFYLYNLNGVNGLVVSNHGYYFTTGGASKRQHRRW
jgi:hypothetical protein